MQDYRAFAPDGYGAKKNYFPSVESKRCYEEIEKVTRDPLAYRQLMKDFNKKRKTCRKLGTP